MPRFANFCFIILTSRLVKYTVVHQLCINLCLHGSFSILCFMLHHWLSIVIALDYLGLFALCDPCYSSSIANEWTVYVCYVYVLMCGDTYPEIDCLNEGPIVIVMASRSRMSKLCNEPASYSYRGFSLTCHSLRFNEGLMNGDV